MTALITPAKQPASGEPEPAAVALEARTRALSALSVAAAAALEASTSGDEASARSTRDDDSSTLETTLHVAVDEMGSRRCGYVLKLRELSFPF
jgi:hypothetical protein